MKVTLSCDYTFAFSRVTTPPLIRERLFISAAAARRRCQIAAFNGRRARKESGRSRRSRVFRARLIEGGHGWPRSVAKLTRAREDCQLAGSRAPRLDHLPTCASATCSCAFLCAVCVSPATPRECPSSERCVSRAPVQRCASDRLRAPDETHPESRRGKGRASFFSFIQARSD